ncbi:MAG TPA: symmetrical bis(5'-nucleosyl)-tetraphosphatase [Gammaproteobacteria bacterium]
MTTYAIGDIQGCYDELRALLKLIHFDAQHDTLWFVGDLVNRGPKSLETLRFVKSLGDRTVTVLGNHDLHLLATWQNKHRHFKSNDTLAPIFAAAECDELMEWLRQRPLLHHDAQLGYTMVHAGLPPQWDLAVAQQCAREVEEVLRGDKFKEFLGHMYGNKPNLWNPALNGWERLRFIVNCFTRLRFCTPDGELEFDQKGHPDQNGTGHIPWFRAPKRCWEGMRIVFGHWSTLGLHRENNTTAIDSGCLWGGRLTALRLDDGAPFTLPCGGYAAPGGD